MLGTKLLISVALLGATLASGAVLADPPQHPTHGVNARLRHQNARIEQGEKSGSLTGRESARLEARDARIRRQETRMRHSGGKFTVAERERLQREENRSSRAIYRQKHDAQRVH